MLPVASLWSVASLPNGDIVVSSRYDNLGCRTLLMHIRCFSDGRIFIYTQEEKRFADISVSMFNMRAENETFLPDPREPGC